MRESLHGLNRTLAVAGIMTALVAVGLRAAEGAPSDLTMLDKTAGFRNQNFGAAPPHEMVLAETDGNLKFYHRPGDSLEYGKAMLTEIIYGYYKDQFFVAILKTKGKKNGRALLDVFDDEYGTPAQPNASLERYAWSGKINSASFTENPATGEVKAAIVNNAIDTQRDADAAGER
jgi:hypothetical protein